MIELLGTVRLDLAEGLVLLIVGYGLVYFLWVQIAGAALTRRERAHVRATHADPDRRRHDLFVLVPCRDEELVVEATTRALLAQDDSSVVVVIDDASTDRTAEIADTVAHGSDRVVVLRRRLPDARVGKGAALNAALDVVRSEVARRGLDPHQVVVGVMDADGQLSPGTTDLVGRLFDDDAVGGVQLQVRIRNRQHFLTRVQDIGFWGTSAVAQMGRNQSRSVSLGGNGQFARLAALDSIDGPAWSDSLTEDLDLMISLTVRGWDMRMTSLAHVEQEGPETVRALVRQRTRWAQGHMLCTGQRRGVPVARGPAEHRARAPAVPVAAVAARAAVVRARPCAPRPRRLRRRRGRRAARPARRRRRGDRGLHPRVRPLPLGRVGLLPAVRQLRTPALVLDPPGRLRPQPRHLRRHVARALPHRARPGLLGQDGARRTRTTGGHRPPGRAAPGWHDGPVRAVDVRRRAALRRGGGRRRVRAGPRWNHQPGTCRRPPPRLRGRPLLGGRYWVRSSLQTDPDQRRCSPEPAHRAPVGPAEPTADDATFR